jgi:hypothetical protein
MQAHRKHRIVPSLIALALVAVLSVAGQAQSNKKSTPAPAKPSAPSKPAATSAARPSAGGAASRGVTTAAHGPVAGGARAGAEPGRPGGAAVAHGAMAHPAPAGSHEMHAANGSAVRMRPNGRPADVHDAARGMDIHHNLGGGRRVSVERPDHSRLVYERGRPGYIAHPYSFHGHEFARRTYYWHGRAYDRFYRPYGFHGIALEVYAPVRFYPVAFYGWAYHPWAVSVRFGWGWGGAPWYGYYGAYFTPYPVYPGPNYWLTDYMISQSLQEEYEAQLAAGAPPPLTGVTPLSPDVKAEIAAEVQRQLALENSEAALNAQGQPTDPASSGIARVLYDGQPHVFVAGKEIDVVDASGQECAITDGDVLQLTNPPGPNDTSANLVVLASKRGIDCRRSDVVSVPFDDLQEMFNHMRETVDQGLQELAAKQGQSGLPPAPASALAAPVTAEMAQNAPPPDPSGAADLAAQDQQAQQSEQEVLKQTGGGPSALDAPPPPPAEPASVSIDKGQTTDQVKAALGEPTRIVTLGSKTIYFFKDMKVTFLNGKVSNIE